MMGLIGVIALLTILGLSLVVTRVATVALTLTGLSEESARFQARSAFTGTGFTTREAEHVVDHPVRRRIIMGLMLLRSAGIVSILLSLILSFAGSAQEDQLDRLLWLLGGVVALWLLSLSKPLDGLMKRLMTGLLSRLTDLQVRDYVGLLKLSGDYLIRELKVNEGDWLAERTLEGCRLDDEGVRVLGLYREDGRYLGAPAGDTQIEAGDSLILYGKANALKRLAGRRTGEQGDRDHANAVAEESD